MGNGGYHFLSIAQSISLLYHEVIGEAIFLYSVINLQITQILVCLKFCN